jgi:hypothetical protein
MEFNTVPYFETKDARGIEYSRVPKLLFPADSHGRSVLMQDVTMYSTGALADSLRSWLKGAHASSGRFEDAASWHPQATAEPISFRQGPRNIPLSGFEGTVKTAIEGAAFCLEWTSSSQKGVFPEYYKQVEGKRIAVSEAEVPVETRLADQTFTPASNSEKYSSPATGKTSWTVPGPKTGQMQASLTDGSTVTYAWYRFVDQPALQNLKLSAAQKAGLQRFVERLHAKWIITEEYIPPPSRGTLAALDSAILVKPPKGLELGYVPIVVDQTKKVVKLK